MAKKTKLSIQYIGDNGRILNGEHPYYRLTTAQKEVFVAALTRKEIPDVHIRIYVGHKANEAKIKSRWVTRGEANVIERRIKIYLRNITHDHIVNGFTHKEEYLHAFLSVIAHEIGHILDYYTDREDFRRVSDLELEYRAEEYVAALLGENYCNKVLEEAYKKRRSNR